MTPTALIGRPGALAAALLLVASGGAGCIKMPEAEECPTGIWCPAGWNCAARQAICINDGCADGSVQEGEVCDDGNKEDGDGCSANCRSNETCGNGILDAAMGELCDDGNRNSGDGCSGDCRSIEGCGNGNIDPGEDCDGGPSATLNQALETSSCNSNCKWVRCGDGVVNMTAGEDCDRDGNGVPGTNGQSGTCNADCSTSVCGDGVENTLAGETCDDGADNGETRDCLPSCQPNVCGDGFVNGTLVSGEPKEECDEGGANSDTGACLRNCRAARCGDAHVRTGVEDCDTGPESATTKTECTYGLRNCTVCSACDQVALTGPYCGDGTRQSAYEACDDGPRNGDTSCDYGTASCQICNAGCSQLVDRVGPVCGDWIRQSAYEACDDGDTVTETACDYGQPTCTLCNASCTATLSLRGPFCGDGFVNGGGETCDHAASVACRTCGAPGMTNACRIIAVQAATGSISIVSMNVVGVTLRLDDGVSTARPRTFEFISGGSAQPGNVAVNIAGVTTLEGIAQLVVSAIQGYTKITASQNGSLITLSNETAGWYGNNMITVEAPTGTTPPTFTGMAGGIGCPIGIACGTVNDCVGVGVDPNVQCKDANPTCHNN